MRGSRRTTLLRTLYAVLAIEGSVLLLGAGTLGVMAAVIRQEEGEKLSGLDAMLAVTAILAASLAALCASSILAVRSSLRHGYGALGRAATLGMIHLWLAILVVTLRGPLWLLAPTGVPATFYLGSWWLLKERRRDALFLPENEVPRPRRAEGERAETERAPQP